MLEVNKKNKKVIELQKASLMKEIKEMKNESALQSEILEVKKKAFAEQLLREKPVIGENQEENNGFFKRLINILF